VAKYAVYRPGSRTDQPRLLAAPHPGVDLTTEQPHPWPGVSAHQLVPHRVDGVAGGDHAALHVLVGVGPSAALAQIEPGAMSWLALGAGSWVATLAGIDPDQQRDYEE